MTKNKFLSLASIIILSSLFLTSCTTYQTNLKKEKISNIDELKKGKTCSHNIFGGFSIPYLGDTAIRINGDESVIAAIRDAKIKEIYAVDKLKKNYIMYSKRCSIVYGK